MNDTTPSQDRQSWLKTLWKKLKGNGDPSLRESLEEVLEGHEEGEHEAPLSEEGREMLLNVLKYNEQRADDIMVPRADIVAFDIEGNFSDLVEAFRSAGHSRLPIYRGSLDNVLGMIHVKDVLQTLGAKTRSKKEPSIESIIRDVIVVPPSMKLIDLLKRMKSQRTHMAIVIDEYGGADGLVTIEDLVEQIVGEIEDEHDEAEELGLTFIGSGIYEAAARVSVEELEEVLGVDLLSDEVDETVDTLGGLVFTLEGRVPEVGEALEHTLGYKFEIIDADPRRINRVRIHLPPKEETKD
jgi:CBS domain containing-hemolysin-like protein